MKTIRYTEAEILDAVGPLTRTRLHRLVETECVVPQRHGEEPVYTEAEIARLNLLCELTDDFDLDEEALPLVMNLIDQIHGLRRQMRLMLRVIDQQPQDVRERLRTAMQAIDG